MLTYTYISKGKFGLVEKPKPMIQHERDAIVKVTLPPQRRSIEDYRGITCENGKYLAK